LNPRNFDSAGIQQQRLGDLMPSTAGQAVVVNVFGEDNFAETR
jgi:hypothetical protein